MSTQAAKPDKGTAARKPGLFPTFFLSGFECSTFIWKDVGRRDLVAETQHLEHALGDYQMLRELGIAVAREGIPWPNVERDGTYDFSIIDPLVEGMNRSQIMPIWDLCHYGYPSDADPFAPDFADRFAAYARAAAEYVIPRVEARGPNFFTPINEITYFAQAGGHWGLMAPHGNDRERRDELRLRLCAAAIAGAKAIREVDPEARMVNLDPLVNVVSPRDRPDLEDAARHETYEDTFVALDILAGKQHPELGGSPEILDIVGVNCYSFGQMEYQESGRHKSLPPDDDRILPTSELISHAWERYRRPMIIAETSGLREGRTPWLTDVMKESLAAVYRGIDLHGICLFPAVDMPDWNTGEWLHNGIADLVDQDGTLNRVMDDEYVGELRRWQKILNRVETLPEDPFSDPVELQDVIDAAHRFKEEGDANWH